MNERALDEAVSVIDEVVGDKWRWLTSRRDMPVTAPDWIALLVAMGVRVRFVRARGILLYRSEGGRWYVAVNPCISEDRLINSLRRETAEFVLATHEHDVPACFDDSFDNGHNQVAISYSGRTFRYRSPYL